MGIYVFYINLYHVYSYCIDNKSSHCLAIITHNQIHVMSDSHDQLTLVQGLEFSVLLFDHTWEAGQIGPKPNRPKVKSAPSQIGPSQIGPKSNRPQVKSAPFLLFTIVNMQS